MLFWYKIFEADLRSHDWITTLAFRMLWMLGIGFPSKTLNRKSCDCCLFSAVWHLSSEGSSAAHPGQAWVTLRSQSPDAAVPAGKRQKREVCIILNTEHAGQQLARCVIFQKSWKMLFFRRTWWDSCIPCIIQSLAPAPRAGHRVRVLVICLPLLLNQSWANQSASISAAPLSYKTEGNIFHGIGKPKGCYHVFLGPKLRFFKKKTNNSLKIY